MLASTLATVGNRARRRAPPLANVVLTTLTLTSAAASGAHPFTFGHSFKEGHATSVALDLPSNEYVATVLCRWPDGSVKHARFEGVTSFTQNVAKTIRTTSGSAPGGAALTHADLVAAAPTATVQCGAIGTVSLATLMGSSPFRTWSASQQLIEEHYVGQVGSSNLLAWFFVRLYAGGRVWVGVCVENGYFDTGSGGIASISDSSSVPTVTIGGTQVYTNGGASLNTHAYAAWHAEGWIGTNPQITPSFDTDYLIDTKLWPHYPTEWRQPDNATLNAQDGSYAPMSIGQHLQVMYSTGAQDGIGIVPNWDALYLTSGDARAYRAVLANALSVESFPITRRDRTTRLIPKPSSFSTWTVYGPNGGPNVIGENGGNGANEWPPTNGSATDGVHNYWEQAHHPSCGYTAWLLTADFRFYEIMQKQAFMCWAMQSNGSGSGTSRQFRQQTRTAGWSMRTVAQLIAVAPDSDSGAGTFVADMRAVFNSNVTGYKTLLQGAGTQAALGGLWFGGYGAWTTTGSIGPWMGDYLVMSLLHALEIKAVSALSDLQTVVALASWFTVHRFGESGDPTQYPFTDAAQYGLVYATSNAGTTWYQTPGAVYTASFGGTNSAPSNTLGGGGSGVPSLAPTGYWGYAMAALAMAVDAGVPGAAAGWARLTGASNWSTINNAGFDNKPVFGIKPRS